MLTPFESPNAGAILLTAVASRASLAWLERLSRTAAREAQLGTGNGKHAGPRSGPGAEIELRAANVPAAVRELAGSLTAFGPVSPTLLCDHAGALNACLFLPPEILGAHVGPAACHITGRRLSLEARERGVAGEPPRALEREEVLLETRVRESPLVALAERRDHPTSTTCSSRGPWTPTVSARSMSAVRLGPVIRVT